jgi:heme-degrading monooxygenase HmoA
MIKRIVKLTFRPEAVDIFIQEVFEQSKDQIRSFPGCISMELLRSIEEPQVFFTLSVWESAEDLEKYRRSALFSGTWKRTKVLFLEKAEAWSVLVADVPH